MDDNYLLLPWRRHLSIFLSLYPARGASAGDVTEVARVLPQSKLVCNVQEHHNLEDYLQQLQTTTETLRQQLQDKRVLFPLFNEHFLEQIEGSQGLVLGASVSPEGNKFNT